MTAALQSQYRNRLSDAGLQPLTSVDQTRATFGEGAAAAFRYTRDEGLSVSRARAYEPHLAAREDALAELAGERLVLPYGAAQEPWYPEAVELARSGDLGLDADRRLVPQSPRAMGLSRRISPEYLKAITVREQLRRRHPDKILSDEEIDERVAADLAGKRATNQDVMGRASAGSQFVGTMAGVMTDPAVLATLPLGVEAQGPRLLANAARAFGSEFVIGSASEALIQGAVYDFKKAIESPYSKAEAVLNVLAAGLGSGVIRAAGSAVLDAGAALKAALQREGAAEALARGGIDPEIALRIADEMETRAASRPPTVSATAHSDAVDAAVHDLGDGRLALSPESDLPGPMSLTQRIATDSELRQDLEALNDFLPEPAELLDEGLPAEAWAANEAAMVARATEIDEVGVERLAVQYEDDPAKFMAGVKGIIDAREKGPTTASGRPPGFDAAEAKELTGTIRAEGAGRALDGGTGHVTERSVAESISTQPLPKPRVTKGGKPVESLLADDLPDVKVAVAERDDGTIETKSVKTVIKEIDDEMRALDRVEACVRGAA